MGGGTAMVTGSVGVWEGSRQSSGQSPTPIECTSVLRFIASYRKICSVVTPGGRFCFFSQAHYHTGATRNGGGGGGGYVFAHLPIPSGRRTKYAHTHLPYAKHIYISRWIKSKEQQHERDRGGRKRRKKRRGGGIGGGEHSGMLGAGDKERS